MKRLLGKVGFVGIIVGAYFLVSAVIQGNDFEEKSIKLMQQQSAKVMAELEKIPGCSGRYTLKTTAFDKEGFFSKAATGRTIYSTPNNNILDIKWTAEVVDDGRMVIVQPKDVPSLQATLMALGLSACRGA